MFDDSKMPNAGTSAVMEKQSQVFGQFEFLIQSTNRLHGALDVLATKLGPILTPPQIAEGSPDDSDATVMVASRIQEQRRIVEQAIQRVNDLSERSETYE